MALGPWSSEARKKPRYDLLLCPCSPVPAHRHGLAELTVGGQVVPARHALRATIPWDVTGSPALAMSFGWSEDGLPVAVQLVGRHFDEGTVPRAGLALEPFSEVAGTAAEPLSDAIIRR